MILHRQVWSQLSKTFHHPKNTKTYSRNVALLLVYCVSPTSIGDQKWLKITFCWYWHNTGVCKARWYVLLRSFQNSSFFLSVGPFCAGLPLYRHERRLFGTSAKAPQVLLILQCNNSVMFSFFSSFPLSSFRLSLPPSSPSFSLSSGPWRTDPEKNTSTVVLFCPRATLCGHLTGITDKLPTEQKAHDSQCRENTDVPGLHSGK